MKTCTTLIGSVLAVTALAALGCGGADPGAAFATRQGGASVVTSAGALTLSIGAAGPLTEGSFTAYDITLTNTTPSAMTSVVVGADFPDTTFNGLPAICVKLGGRLSQFNCGIGTIAAGASVSIDFQIRPNLAGTLTYTAFSGGNAILGNSVEDTEDVAPAPTDMQVTGFASTGSPPLGSVFTYTFQVKNNGPFATFGGVSFSDSLPASLAYAGVSTSNGSCTGGQVVSCALGDLAVGVQAIVQISVQAPSVPQTIVDTASISLPQQTDRQPANNAVSVTVATK